MSDAADSDPAEAGQDVIPHRLKTLEEPEAERARSEHQRGASTGGDILAASYQFMGPIPSPQDLARYEAVIPGLADRLISRFEKQSDHRMQMESDVTSSDAHRANLGLVAGFAVALATIISSTVLIMHGHDWPGTVLGGGTLASLVGTFVYGSNSRRQERVERQKVLMEPDEEKEQ